MPVHLHFACIWRGWTEAVASLPDNPLAQYWGRPRRRHKSELARVAPWFGYGVLVILGLMVSTLGSWNNPTFNHYAGGSNRLIYIVALSFLPACLLFGLSRLYSSFRDGLGLLAEPAVARRRVCLDDLIACSALTEQELLCGTFNALMRPLVGPVILSASLFTLLHVLLRVAVPVDPFSSSLIHPTLQAFLLLPFELVLRIDNGLLAASGCILLAISLGSKRNSAALALWGASAIVVVQLALFASGVARLDEAGAPDYGFPRDLTNLVVGSNIALMPLSVGLGLYLARRLETLRFALGGLAPAVVACFYLLYSFPSYATELYEYLYAVTELNWSLAAFLVFNPEQMLIVSGDSSLYYNWWRAPLLLLFQLIMLVMLAEFARDAVRRRKWGHGES